MQITVFGMGYVGCVTAARLTDMGHSRDNIRLSGPGGHRHPGCNPVLIEPTLIYPH